MLQQLFYFETTKIKSILKLIIDTLEFQKNKVSLLFSYNYRKFYILSDL